MIPNPLSRSEPLEAPSNRIAAQQLILILNRLPSVIVAGSLCSSALIIAIVWNVASAREMVVWLAAHFVTLGLLSFVFLRYRDMRHSLPAVAGRSLRWSLLVLGGFWGTFLMYTCVITPVYVFHLYVFMFVGSLGVFSLVLLAEDLRCFLAFTTPLFAAVSGFALASGESRLVGLSALGLLCFGTLVLFARGRQRGSTEALRLRFEVIDLANELRQQRDAAQEANLAKSKFFAAASHDLRQPVHALTLLTSALTSCELGTTAQLIAGDIARAVDSLERLFDSLLDVSKLDAGIVSPSVRHLNLDELIEPIVCEMLPEARRRGLQLEYARCDAVVRSDPMLLERILRNFLSNAVRYTHHGSIRVSCKRQGENLRIEVKDSGVGIALEHHAAIFAEFHQVENSERDRSKGLGLGLAIVRRIADLLEHPYGVESSLGRGARFFVVVPLGDSGATESQPPVSRNLMPSSLLGLRVVIIDDDAMVRNGTHTLLSTWHCEVTAACSISEALERIRKSSTDPDALVVDYRLTNGETGLRAIEAIRRERGYEIPALVISGDTTSETLMEVAARRIAMIHKPVQPAVLRAFLSSVHRQRRGQDVPAI